MCKQEVGVYVSKQEVGVYVSKQEVDTLEAMPTCPDSVQQEVGVFGYKSMIFGIRHTEIHLHTEIQTRNNMVGITTETTMPLAESHYQNLHSNDKQEV